MSASKFTRFKNKLSLHQKIKESESSAHRRNNRNDAENDRGPHDKLITTSLSSSGPHPVQAFNANLCPIDELWNDAYDELRGQEENLMKDYEATLCSDLATMVGSTVILSGSKVERRGQMMTLLSRKVDEVKKNTWKLRFAGHDVQLKDLAQPVVDIIQWADEHISGALSANPYASIAWAGVSLLLPLTLNPSKQAASLAAGLDYISDLIVRSTMRENLYKRRYESQSSEDDRKTLLASHMMYRDTLKKLYVQILRFQASSVCYLSKSSAFRLGLDIVKWDNWDSSLSDVQKREDAFREVYNVWKDLRDQEDCKAIFARHQAKMNVMISIRGDISGLRNAIEHAQGDTKRTDLLNWLSTIDPSESFNVGLDKVRAGTGDWLLNGNSDFEDWKTSPNSFAWLNGKAGSGKSVLSSSIIKHLKERNDSNPEAALAFFYFSFTDAKTQNAIEMLCSLIKQICCRRPDTPQSVQSLAEYKEKGQRPDRRTLENTLVATIRGFSRVFVVLDALDECPFNSGEREKLLDSICRFRKQASENLHLLCTSRRETDIAAVLDPVLSSHSNMDIDLSTHKKAIDHDIGLHIDNTFGVEPFKSWPNDIKYEARAALIEKADGMFQYVACQFDSLRRHRAPARIRAALKDLPKGLDSTYDRMLQGIDPEYQRQVASVLKWLAFSIRPLLLDELAEVFILDHEKDVPFDENDRLFTVEEVLTYLPGLVTKVPIFSYYDHCSVRHGTNVTEIRFAHFSIKEYLRSSRIGREYYSTPEQSTHLYISECCLAYHLQLSESMLATEDNLKRYALWEYAAQYLASHLEKVALQSWTVSVTNRVKRMFASRSQSLLNMVRICSHDGEWRRDWKITPDKLASPLYYAVSMGAFQLTSLLIHNNADINEAPPTASDDTILQGAIYSKHKAIIKLLLEHNADVNAQGGYYGNALQEAAIAGDLEVVQLLLDNGTTINPQGRCREERCVGQVPLRSGAQVNAEGGYLGNALQAAAVFGELDILQLLLDRGADINTKGGRYGTALQAAASRGYLDILQVLFDNGADVNAKGGPHGNALQAAVARDHLDIVEVILARGANIDPPGLEWEQLIARVRKNGGDQEADRLRKLQEDPTGYIEWRRRREREEDGKTEGKLSSGMDEEWMRTET